MVKKKITNKDYERIGRLVHSIGETGHMSRRQLYKISLIKGIWTGLGSVIGATIVVSILLAIFALLGNVPLIGPVIDLVQDSIN
ncbi:MAG: hypothetical protein ACI9T8_000484 [Candidatus Saccharimonadales bacterium]|jgi:hypothetical protein